jgi:hypothetical protein
MLIDHRLASLLERSKLSKRRLLRSLPAVMLASTIGLSRWPDRFGLPEAAASGGELPGIPTQITVRVIANGGKYLGDDIGGAQVTIRDAITGAVLAGGTTQGGSGSADLMSIELNRTEPVPDDDASSFQATLALQSPRQVQIEAFGPLAAQGSAGRASVTRWLLPGNSTPDSNSVLITLDGLVVQILHPPTHYLPAVPAPLAVDFRANVTMMCGCPIGPNEPWPPQDFEVRATINNPDGSYDQIPLAWDSAAPDKAPSQFIGTWTAPVSGIYEATVTAWQRGRGNVGVDRATFIVP